MTVRQRRLSITAVSAAWLAASCLLPLAASAQPADPVPAPDPSVPALPAPPVEEDPAPADDAPSVRPVPSIAGQQATARGPESVADLAESLLDAVVNISTSQSVDRPGGGIPRLEAPEGSPLQDFFDDLLRGDDGVGDRRVQSLGSGFVVDPSGIVITNNHVIADADTITVNFADGSRLDAELLGRDPKTDLAVLKVDPPSPLAAVEFGDSEGLRIGDWVMAIGNPFGLGGSVSIGIVSARGRNINAGPYDSFIQTDAAINRGNSGGPLFDMYGRVVGINTAIISPTGGSIGIGFSIPAQLAVNVVDQLREFGETRRGWLGIRLQAVTDDIAAGLGIDEAKGAVVMGIVPGGPSDNGLLTVGDVIVRFDGHAIESSRDLPRIVAETPVGKTVTVDILRKEDTAAPARPLSVEVTLGRLEDGERLMAESEAADDATADPDASGEDATPAATVVALGMTLSQVDATLRGQYDLADDVEGVVITEVAPNSSAAEKGIEAGAVIREVAQEEVSEPQEVADKIAELKAEGRRNALLLLATSSGDLRFVVVPID
jgi:serine protease Do